jgi:bifunctional phosphoglucose/phosphomannose isomerase
METIECARRAIERGAPVCGVAGEGSRLHRLLENHGFPVVTIKTRGLPRTSLGLLVGSILGLLLPFREALAQVELVSRTLRADWALDTSRRVASAIADGLVPVVVACGSYAPLAWRWKSELAENAKLHAMVEVYPEAGHNTINAWEHTSGRGRYVFIVLKANVDDKVCAHIEDWVEDTYNRVGETVTVDLRGFARVHQLAAVLAGSMVAGITSSILAVNRGKDPSAITGIQRYKNALRAFRGEGILG